MVKVRDANPADIPGLVAIYNDVIATSTAVYRNDPSTVEERLDWLASRTAQGYPVLVGIDQDGVAGFASFGDFRPWPGYRYTVEHSVHVRSNCRAQGLGTALMQELVRRATSAGKHVMIAGVDAENDASIRFHERLGFQRVGHFREVGFKFGRWLDLVFLQLRLTS